MADGGIIVEKRIVYKAVDEVTAPLASMNARLSSLENRLSSLGMKFSEQGSKQTSFKEALNSTKASVTEVGNSFDKLEQDVNRVHSKDVKITANTSEGQRNVKNLNKDVDETKTKTDEAGRSGRSMTKSFVLGGAILNGLQMAGTYAMGFAKQGFQAAIAGQEMTERWSKLGMTRSEISATGSAVKDLKENTNLSGSAVGNLVTRFYGFTGSASRAVTLAKGVGSIADSLHMSNQAADSFARGLTQIESSGKVTSRSLGLLEKQAPGLTKALQQASGMSAKSFQQLLESGKMTSDQFNNLLANASKTYKKNADDWDSTTQGAMKHIKQTWADDWQSMMKPLTQSSSSGFGALSKSMSALTPEFTQLGKYISQVATGFAKWLTPQHAKDLGEIVGSVGSIAVTLGKGVWKAVTFPLEIIGKIIDKLAGNKHVDALDEVAKGLEWISKNKGAQVVLQVVGGLLATQFAYSKLFKIADGLGLINKALVKAGKAKFTGHLVSDLAKQIKGLGKIKINPANWFKGGASWVKNLFKPLPEEALRTGETSGGNFITRFAAKTNASRFAQIGRSTGGRIISGVGLAIEAYDFIKDIYGAFTTHNGTTRSRDVGKAAGAGIGAGIGFFFGGPAGAALGGLIGRAIGGKIGPSVGKFGNSIGKILEDIFVKHDWGKVWSTIGKGWQSFWKGMGSWWDKTIGKKGSSSSSSSKSKEPSRNKIKSLGGNHYSRADIANIKAMNSAVKAYTSTLRTLKSTIKKNDPTKELNSMNKSLKQSAKYWLAVSKPIKQASKSFQDMKKPLDAISKSMKDLTGKKSGLGTFDKDLSKLEKDLHRSKIGEEFTKLSKEIKKSDLVKTLQRLTKEIRESVKYWKEFAKPVRQTTTEFQRFNKELKPFNGKNNPLDRLDKSIQSLTKTIKKDRFGNELAKQMQIANKSMNGRNSVEVKFSSMTRTIERDLTRFRSSFDRDWRRTWDDLSSDPSRTLSRVISIVTGRLNTIVGREHSFSAKFLSGWRSWNNSVVSEMRSAFDKLPGIAQRAAENIVSRLNRGISGINKVIGDFGGDKKLGTISYARGTFTHPGGKAIINDGPQPDKTELVWQPSRGWQTFNGQNRAVDLEAGSMVMDASHSAPLLNRFGGLFPHYADGSLSDEEMDKLAEQFENNPISASKSLMLKFTDWSGADIFQTLGKAEAVGFSSGISNVLKDLLGEVKEPKNGDWTPVIKSAARLLHVTLSAVQIGKLLRQIQSESGGKERQIQLGSSNDPDGDGSGRAIGLLQFKRSTFEADHVPGHDNIMSGFDQILAAIATLNRGGEGGWGNIGNGHGWASGVHMTHRDLAWIGDNAQQDEYVINPYAASALPLMRDAMDTMAMAHPEWRNSASSADQSTGQVVAWLKEVVKAVNNIDLQPVLPVDETRQVINKMNAADVRLMS